MNLPRRTLPFLLPLWAVTALPVAAWAQFGAGGTTGATLADADVYASVQETKGTPLNDRARELFLNRANCQCQVPVWLSAVVLPAAAARAAAVSPSATVSMYIGNGCDSTATLPCCHRLASTTFSQFRLTGLIGESTVDDLARIWSTTSGNCGNTRSTVTTGSGGATGTGGAGGTSDAGGTSGTDGTGGAGGTGVGGTGGAVVTGSTGAVCDGTLFGQTLWIFVGTSGDGSHEIATKTLGFNVDPEPPAAPTDVTLGQVHEALVVNWTGLSTSSVNDLLGYQILCTRGDATQVFKDGTYTASFDACPGADTSWPQSALPRSSFVCSELLSPSATSSRVKILENGITYGVGVAAIDKKGNASAIVPAIGVPMATRDFYHDYRNGDPQGGATGGYCGVSGGATSDVRSAPLVALAVVALARRRRRNRGREERSNS